MPSFEIEPRGEAARRVRGRSPADALARVTGRDDAEVSEPEAGLGWCDVRVGGELWGRVRSMDRMRFRRD